MKSVGQGQRHDDYECGHCHEVFQRTRSDEEAYTTETVERFGEVPPDEQVIVCDECWKMMTTEYPPKQWAADGYPAF